MTHRERIDYIVSAINNDNLNDPELRKLQQLYMKISNVYNDPFKLSQFMNVISNSLLLERAPTFTGLPYGELFRNFYSTFFNLLIDPSTHGSRDERATVIRNSLRLNNLINHIVIKYDYYFTGVVVAKINTDIPEPESIQKVENFILIQRDRYLLIWNTKTHEKKMFAFPDTDPEPNIFYAEKHILYADNKFAIGIRVDAYVENSEGPQLSTYIGLLDFNTGEQQYHRFADTPSIYDIKIVNDKILVSAYDSVRMLDVNTLEEKRINFNPVFFVLPYDNNTKIIIGGRGSITFYNLQDQLFITTINFSNHGVTDIQLLNEHTFIARTGIHIATCDIKTRSVIKQVDIPALETEPYERHIFETHIRKVLILKDKIIVQTAKRIFIFDYDLDLKFTGQHIPMINFMDVLPNDQLITISRQGLIKIWEFEGFELHPLHEIEGGLGHHNILLNGLVYRIKDGQIVVYE